MIDNVLVRNHFIIVMIRWTSLASWEIEFPVHGRLRGCGVVLRERGGRGKESERERARGRERQRVRESEMVFWVWCLGFRV